MPVLIVDNRETRDMIFGLVDDLDRLVSDLNATRQELADANELIADLEAQIAAYEKLLDDTAELN